MENDDDQSRHIPLGRIAMLEIVASVSFVVGALFIALSSLTADPAIAIPSLVTGSVLLGLAFVCLLAVIACYTLKVDSHTRPPTPTPLTVHRMPEETKADSEPHWSEFPLTLVGSPIHYTPERISPSSSNLSWETLQSPLLLAKARSLVSIPHFSMSEPIRRASSASLDLRSKSVN